MAEGFARDLVGDDFLKFKISLDFDDRSSRSPEKIKFLILLARKEATSLAKLKEKIMIEFAKIGNPDATERQRDATNKQIKRMVSWCRMLTWEDADGDELAIGTDEHLALALDEMPGPLYKFKAQVVPGDSDDVDDDIE